MGFVGCGRDGDGAVCGWLVCNHSTTLLTLLGESVSKEMPDGRFSTGTCVAAVHDVPGVIVGPQLHRVNFFPYFFGFSLKL